MSYFNNSSDNNNLSKQKIKSSHSNRNIDKSTQVIQNFFLKASHIIAQARSPPPSPVKAHHVETKGSQVKLNKWFNLELDEYDAPPREDLKLWRILSSSSSSDLSSSILNLPPLVIETYLDLRDLNNNQTLILLDKGNLISVTRGTKKTEVVLERWLV
ncbi:hypothetical protein PACTADRAFT_62456, partial [Pachysolen tannophilus NRRL Y-2460]